MSHIDDLIQELCPDGAIFVNLASIAVIKTGSAVSKQVIGRNPGVYPVINSGRDPLGYIDHFNTNNDPLGITSRGAGVGSVTWCEGRYFRGNLNYAVTVKDPNQIDVRFLYHLLLHYQPNIQSLCSFQGIPALNKANLAKLRIPIPPLEVQREIVRILDQFTALEAELEAELEARKKQYDCYSRSIISRGEESGCTFIPLGDIGRWSGGGTPSKGKLEFWTDGIIPWVSPKDMGTPTITDAEDHITESAVRQSATRLVPKDSVVFVVRSSILDRKFPVAYTAKPVALNQDLKAIVTGDGIAPRYVFHVLRAFSREILLTARRVGGSVASLDSGKLRAYKIPVPPLDVQHRIVAQLDAFDALVNDLSVGLPAELSARRKQYEYYRDRLLTFKELGAES